MTSRFSGVFSPLDWASAAALCTGAGLGVLAVCVLAPSAVAACVSVRAPASATPRVNVSDFIEGKDSEGESLR